MCVTEYCADCSRSLERNDLAFCLHENFGGAKGKPIDMKLFNEGIIPDWCPLPEE